MYINVDLPLIDFLVGVFGAFVADVTFTSSTIMSAPEAIIHEIKVKMLNLMCFNALIPYTIMVDGNCLYIMHLPFILFFVGVLGESSTGVI